MSRFRYHVCCFAVVALGLAGCGTTTPTPAPESGIGVGEAGETGGAKAPITEKPKGGVGGGKVSFVREIKPILEDRCVMCHNRKTLPKRPSFENRVLALKGDAAGPIIVPGDAEGSRLIVAISAPDIHDRAMPPVSHRVSKAEVALIRRWIDEGVAWPEGPEGDLKSDKIPAE